MLILRPRLHIFRIRARKNALLTWRAARVGSARNFADYQGSRVQIPDSLRGRAFLIDDIRDSNGRTMNPVKQRMGHSCIRVVSLKGLLEATFNQPPQSTITWAPQQPVQSSTALSAASVTSSPAAPTRPPTSACMLHSMVQKAPAAIRRLQKARLPQTLLLRSRPLQRQPPSRFGLVSQKRSPQASGASMPSQSPSRGIMLL